MERLANNPMRKARPNPLRYDPTRTSALRNRFAAEMRGKYDVINRDIRKLLIEDDVFGYSDGGYPLSTNGIWSLQPLGEKLESFKTWLNAKISALVFSASSDGYIEEAYTKGALKGATGLKISATLDKKPIQPNTIVAALKPRLAVERLAIVKTKTAQALEGAGKAVADRVSDIMAEEMVRGSHPKIMAKRITEAVDSIGKKRASTIARTETIRAHAEGALDVMQSMGVTEVGVEVEWSTAGDAKVCPKCAPLEGMIIPIEKAHGMFPRHPNCRCSPIPAFQRANKDRLRDAIEASLGKSSPSSSWPGPAVESFLE